jgi:hypothetical protein
MNLSWSSNFSGADMVKPELCTTVCLPMIPLALKCVRALELAFHNLPI